MPFSVSVETCPGQRFLETFAERADIGPVLEAMLLNLWHAGAGGPLQPCRRGAKFSGEELWLGPECGSNRLGARQTREARPLVDNGTAVTQVACEADYIS